MFSSDFSVLEARREPLNGRSQNGADVRGELKALGEEEKEI